jgi:DNA gyrase subunit A
MDVLPAELADRVASSSAAEEGEAEPEGDEVANAEGPWVLVASASGLGKRVPVDQFRLQKRAGMGLRAIKFRRDGDALIGLRVLGAGEELLLVSERGVIVRMQADAIPQQSRAATGVRLQRLDAGDHLAEVVLVPPAPPEEEGAEGAGETAAGGAGGVEAHLASADAESETGREGLSAAANEADEADEAVEAELEDDEAEG